MNPVRPNRDHSRGDHPKAASERTFGKKKTFGAPSSHRPGGKPSFGGNRNAGRNGGARGSGGRSGGKGARFKGANIDVSRFINKAKEMEKPRPYVSQHAFTTFGFSSEVEKNVVTHGYITPTPIQDQAIPHILLGKDVIGIANTGTGKTAAFLLPLIEKIVKARNEKVIVIVPTRELALQIDMELRGFVRGMGIPSITCIGGSNIREQMRGLRNKYNFVIGTPGRLKDLMERKNLNMSEFGTVVLDEADRMLDMGFINDIKFLLKEMPYTRHSLFFSATLSPDIEKLVGGFLKDPVKISVRVGDTAASVDQDIVRASTKEKKIEILHDMLSKKDFEKVLIFGQTKWGVEKLSNELIKRGFKSVSIHGNKTQGQRKSALELFKGNRVQIMVATDVASRGLDINDVSHVINYDLPATYEDYTHRVGRTGRAGKKGKAITFVD
jgi:superfamily II DNA/RNA helicase